MQNVPLQPVPSQIVNVTLNGQDCTLSIYWRLDSSLYIDVYVSGILIIGGVICEDRNRIVRSVYLGFIGDLAFSDNQGTLDPVYTGLGTRWTLGYYPPAELTSV